MIWLCDLKSVGDDVEVSMDLDLGEYFEPQEIDDLVLIERNDFVRDREMRYFLLEPQSSPRQHDFDINVIDNKTFSILGINQPNREMNLMMRLVCTHTNQGLIFFELHSGFLYPLIDGAVNLPDALAQRLIYNGQDFLEEKHRIFNEFHVDFVTQGFLNQSSDPGLLLFNTHYTDYGYLAGLRLGQEHVDFLNQQGLTVYLSEPILKDNVESSLTYQPNILNLLSTMARNNRLHNVRVCLSEHGFPRHNPLYPGLEFCCDDIFLKLSSFEYVLRDYPKNDYGITKKFWSGNWIYKPHRHIVASHLADRSANLSWHHSAKRAQFNEMFFENCFYREFQTFSEFLSQHDVDLLQKTLARAELLESQVPRVMDTLETLKNDVNDYTLQSRTTNGYSTSLSRFYKESFCGIITETVFDYPYAVLSEKTLCCMINSRPFVLVAPYGSLEYLRSMGFKTFSDVWDESYDAEPSHNARLFKILKLIDHIDSIDLETLNKMLMSIESRLEHNRQLALELYTKSFKQHDT